MKRWTVKRASPEAVAEWMVEELRELGWLYQDEAVEQIRKRFGKDFVYVSESGVESIDTRVLAAFAKLTPDAVWEFSEMAWRFRTPDDLPGRRQD